MTNPYDTYRETDPTFPTIVFTGTNGTDVSEFLLITGEGGATFTQDPTSGVWSLTVNGVSTPVSPGDAIIATVDPSTLHWISRQWCTNPVETPLVVIPGAQFPHAFTGVLVAPPPQPTPTP